MQNIVTKLVVIVLIVALCALALFTKPIRLGADLRGGTSLIYSVAIPEGANPQTVLTQVIEVLKERVNPSGVLDISMNPLGHDRIEIVMPLAGKEVQDLAKAYRASLVQLLAEAEIPSRELTQAIQDETAVDRFCTDAASERCKSIRALQDAYDLLQIAKSAYEQREQDGLTTENPEYHIREQANADAEIAYEDALDAALDYSLEQARVVRMLGLSTQETDALDISGNPVLDAVTGEPTKSPSPRQNALTILESQFPHLSALLDDSVTKYDAYQDKRMGFDDPADLMRLLQGAGVLEFHIAVRNSSAPGLSIDDLRLQLVERGPDNTDSLLARWYPINDLKQWYDTPAQLASLQANPVAYFGTSRYDLVAAEYEGEYYQLLYYSDNKSMTHGHELSWTITQTFPTIDSYGRQAVSFQLDAVGGSLLGQLTTPHVGQPMAIVLDGEVFSAPTLQSAISNNGIITGNFSDSEISYLTRVLAAGSLEARLSDVPIAINTLGPSLGADNLARGKWACIIAVIAVAVFMLGYYFFAGLVANVALLINGILIFGFMAAIDGTFTLPGLAGIVLTIGMAVDANVLIYERIREELFSGEWDLRGAIREGYRKALSTIIDANVTNLIVCFVLAQTATTEVKGFAVTLAIGICATLFTALFVTRQVYYLYTDLFGIEKLTMLPTAVPAIHRTLEPKINWLGLRKIFWGISIVAVVLSIVFVSQRGTDMLDTEFRGGVSAIIKTKVLSEATGTEDEQLLQLAQADVRDRVRALGENIVIPESGPDRLQALVLSEFPKATVITVGETSDAEGGGILGGRFQVKVASPPELTGEENIQKIFEDALAAEFAGQLDTVPPLIFDGAQGGRFENYTMRISERVLGDNIPGSNEVADVRDFVGGVGVMVRDIQPPATLDQITARLERMRQQPDFNDCIGRSVEVFGLDEVEDTLDGGQRLYRDVIVLVYDSQKNYIRMPAELVDTDVAAREWALAVAALTQGSSLEQLSSYSSAVAQTLKAKAIVAVILSFLGILVYIWVRFGSLRYSMAALVALMHDVMIALGILALSGYVAGTSIGNLLFVEDFRINLGVIAALLTIIGYSLNDTIVILDRIRENRGKLPLPTAPIVNTSINQTISRTVLTSVTTLLAVLIMYAEGGSGIRAFTFCLLVGIMVGTYSSVAIAAPLVFKGGEHPKPEAETEAVAS